MVTDILIIKLVVIIIIMIIITIIIIALARLILCRESQTCQKSTLKPSYTVHSILETLSPAARLVQSAAT